MQMSFQEIADSTGVSINTALGRMRYALINLRKKMDKKKAKGKEIGIRNLVLKESIPTTDGGFYI